MHLEVFRFILTQYRFSVIIAQGIEEIEVLLVNVFGDVHAVEHGTFKLLNIRILCADGFNQIVQITEDKTVSADDLADLVNFAAMSDQPVAVGISIP